MMNWKGVRKEIAVAHFKAFCYCSHETFWKIWQNIRKGVLQPKFKMGRFHINIRKYLS
jgi:hypothetical protein